MWKKVLIANRGEIAVRIIRACREAGLQCVTVYSTADKTALHAEIADESVCIGPPSVQDSYLNMNALISACQNTGAEALHPGFGFLSGMGTARAVAAVSGVPLYETSHQVGHVLAALYSAGKLGEREKPFLAFHVSGGTTDSLYCEPDADMAR